MQGRTLHYMPSRNVYKIYLENSYYHVYNRGVNKRVIFQDNQDYVTFLNLLKRYLLNNQPKDRFGRTYLNLSGRLELLAYCLMPNHFHMICSFTNNANPGMVIKNIKRFTAMKLLDAIINNQQESRKKCLPVGRQGCLVCFRKTD